MTNARKPPKKIEPAKSEVTEPQVKVPHSKSTAGLPSGTRARLALAVTEDAPVPFVPPPDVPRSKSTAGLPSGTKARQPDPEIIILREQAEDAIYRGASPDAVAAMFLELAGEPLYAESV
jgi:hypothetical protein